jgi:hypothetical protein
VVHRDADGLPHIRLLSKLRHVRKSLLVMRQQSLVCSSSFASTLSGMVEFLFQKCGHKSPFVETRLPVTKPDSPNRLSAAETQLAGKPWSWRILDSPS